MARHILIRSLLTWFVIDSICPTLSGLSLNFAGNTGFLMMLLWPLAMVENQKAVAA